MRLIIYANLPLNGSEHIDLNVGFALIRRCAWLGAKLAFSVLASVAVLFWLFMTGFIVYKSIRFGVSPMAILAAFNNDPMNSLLIFLLGPLGIVVTGTIFCSVIAAGIGAVAAIVQKARP